MSHQVCRHNLLGVMIFRDEEEKAPVCVQVDFLHNLCIKVMTDAGAGVVGGWGALAQ